MKTALAALPPPYRAVLVLREKTERPEAVEAGTVRLVGTSESAIFGAAADLLDNREAYLAMARIHNPYGDGRASEAITATLAAWAQRSPQRAHTGSAGLGSSVPTVPAVV